MQPSTNSYLTVAKTINTEIEVQKSRFLTTLAPASTAAAARQIIADVRAEHPKARHHCTAFILGAQAQTARHSDDGEPAGCAGIPMFETLQTAGLCNVVAVVTRYFGGALLGAAGLTRAYRAAVAEAIAQADIVTKTLLQHATITLSYDTHAQLINTLRRQGAKIGSAEYSETVTQEVWVRPEKIENMLEIAAATTAGCATIKLNGTEYL